MQNITLTKEAARFIAEMLFSCGNARCEPSLKKLLGTSGSISLAEFGLKGGNGWQKPVFSSLQSFALEEGISEIGLNEIVLYFGGRHHIVRMIRKASHSNLGYLMGPEAGLVLDVLLPLDGNLYKNGEHSIEFANFAEVSPKKGERRFIHRGLVVSAGVTDLVVESVLSEQLDSPEFSKALLALGRVVMFPENFILALKSEGK